MKVSIVIPFDIKHPTPPLGVGYIASVLKKERIDVSILDINVIGTEYNFKKEILRLRPDVVGFSIPTIALATSLNFATIIKNALPNCYIIFGGPHPTIDPKGVLKNHQVDAVVIGEGEYTLLDLCRCIENKGNLKTVDGLVYRNKNQIIFNKPREFIKDLDTLPYPDRALLHTDYYLSLPPIAPFTMPYININAHRGCPFNCLYCQPTAKKLFGLKVRMRSPKEMVAEAKILAREYKPKTINFSADTFTCNKEWTLKFCEEYIKAGVNVPFWINGRVGTLDREVIHELKKAGCYFISFGVETGNQELLNFLRRNMTLQQIKDTFAMVSKEGILTGANIMVGNPGETKESLRDTMNLLKVIQPDYVGGPYITNPLIGTDLYDYSIQKGMLTFDGDYSKMSRVGMGNLKLENFTPKEIVKARDDIVKMLFWMRIGLIFKRKQLRRAIIRRLLNLLVHLPSVIRSLKRNYRTIGIKEERKLSIKLQEIFIKGI